ncbi:sensor domain-containing diguanylate cyclase [Bordetella avium]|uniref:Signaling protein n=1 Tax=Bordetella avium (strain 197N) TaxID=360910 RepID=Q2KVB5_BORA1|nr:GGDEF domain-containing protein [Bordetella avium]WQE32706.1 diguanylate cyclase [Bordetella avium]CAJ48612.1 putative signaling protein [Bordetella avium 197N]SUV69608.1 signaling protein [Bordetella avium]
MNAPERNLSMPHHALELLQLAINQSFNSVLITTAGVEPIIVYSNPALCAMTGYTAEELIGNSPKILQGPLTDKTVINRLRLCLKNGDYFQGSTFNYRKDGSPYLVEWNISPVRGAQGGIEHFVSVQRDITARTLAQQRQALLAQALNATHDAVLIADDKGHILFTNQAFQRAIGYSAKEVHQLTPQATNSGQPHPDFYKNLLSVIHGGKRTRHTFPNQNAKGSNAYIEQVITTLTDESGSVKHYISVLKDISQFVAREKLLSKQVRSDALTGLLNRRGAAAKIQRLHRAAHQSGRFYSVIMADIDHFKKINDQFGHLLGDTVLKRCANLIRDNVREGDAVARWGGEEFLILLPNCPLIKAVALAERIRNTIATLTDPITGQVTLSLGVGTSSPAETPQSLIQRADKALYKAKAQGRNQVAIAEWDQTGG